MLLIPQLVFFSLPIRVFNLVIFAFSLLTRGFELVTRRFELLTSVLLSHLHDTGTITLFERINH